MPTVVHVCISSMKSSVVRTRTHMIYIIVLFYNAIKIFVYGVINFSFYLIITVLLMIWFNCENVVRYHNTLEGRQKYYCRPLESTYVENPYFYRDLVIDRSHCTRISSFILFDISWCCLPTFQHRYTGIIFTRYVHTRFR